MQVPHKTQLAVYRSYKISTFQISARFTVYYDSLHLQNTLLIVTFYGRSRTANVFCTMTAVAKK